jgi:hypothetical protein
VDTTSSGLKYGHPASPKRNIYFTNGEIAVRPAGPHWRLTYMDEVDVDDSVYGG